MNTFLTLVGEFAEALYNHFKSDEQAMALLIKACDIVLTRLGYPDIIPGDPFVSEPAPAEQPSEKRARKVVTS